MFDYHMHTKVSFDSQSEPADMIAAAERAGLKEICFTDHYDFNDQTREGESPFEIEKYRAAYDGLRSDKLKIRHGVEFGITPWDRDELTKLLTQYDFDFVIGSVHYVGGYDPYLKEYWNGKSVREAFEEYLLKTLDAVRANADFDVLGHISYVCKSPNNLSHVPLHYADFSDICDEIMKTLAHNGKGMEINTSGVDRCGVFLPTIDFIKRYKELGGEIVTVGSDAHVSENVGKYIGGALEIARETFGYVCTFEQRKPIFHKL